jgi:lysophospholipase L1-like esterase
MEWNFRSIKIADWTKTKNLQEEKMKIRDVLFFVWGVIAILGIIILVFPKDGLKITDNFILYFPTFEEMFYTSKNDNDIPKIEKQQNIDELIDENKEFDIEEIKSKITPLEFPENNPHALDRFFAKLENETQTGKVRIMHYGDSQIEGDRITAYLRNRLQSKFGGFGCGMLSPITIYAQFSIKQIASENWMRFSGFGYSNYTASHNSYGPMISFCRYSYPVDTPFLTPSQPYKAWVEFFESELAYSNTKKFREIQIIYGNANTKTQLIIKSNNEIIKTDSLNSGAGPYLYNYVHSDYLNRIRFEFESYDSPDIYGISLEDQTGVVVDNIALRGSSGTVFTTTNTELLANSFNLLGVDLFILQFGGNSVPGLPDKKSAENFANYFYYQIAFLKNIMPDACFIVIGPSDMAYKEKDAYISYPNLENIINELKKATHRAGGVYWDLYKAMGGKNSMIAWVNANPPLAAPDFIHFTPQGAQVAANMLYSAIFFEYTNYKNQQNKSAQK